MPTASVVSSTNFLNDYNNFLSYLNYMQQWASSVSSLAAILQADPNFSTALSSAEQDNVGMAAKAAATALSSVSALTQNQQVSP
jgi:hypothetical protein